MSSRVSDARRSALLPSTPAPVIVHARSQNADTLDALLTIVTLPAASDAFQRLPQSGAWRELHRRSAPKAGTVRTTLLANPRHTLAVLGYLKPDASAFERLTLAGRMLKEAAARAPESIGLIAPGREAAGELVLESLLAATLARAFALPSFRARDRDERGIRRVTLFGAQGFDAGYAATVAAGTNLVRWLTALPPNVLDAAGYRTAITRVAREHALKLRWLDERALRRLGAGAFLAVAAANGEAGAGIAHLSYRPARRAPGRAPDVALIGKGILFDTGGVNLKTHRSMLDMHTDMAGSAVALATLVALAQLRAPFAADAWLAITENRIGPRSYKPQDVIRAANGVTIQVIHSDAEGRMVLADTLALAGRTRPRFMIDFATLTGACVYALTERMSGVFTNREVLAGRLVEAGRVSGERVWPFPFAEDYDADIESKIADVMQCAVEGKGDHIHATRFLSRFVPTETPWVHVDLASATRSGGLAHVTTDVTGFGVRFALELLLRQNLLGALGKTALMRLQLTRPDDWHLHLRDGAALAAVLPFTVAQFARAIVMPNLKSPVTTTALARAYRERILAALPAGARFKPLMTLYLTDRTSIADISEARASGFVYGVKLYPAGATTHAEAGVTDLARLDPVLAHMAEVGLVLQVHGEVTDPAVDVFDREARFIDTVLAPLIERHARLRVVFEHITTRAATQFVLTARAGVAATVTPQHLLLNRNALFNGGIRPHLYCLPVLKAEAQRLALLEAVASGTPRIFLGTDSAPHARGAKENACGCAGIFSAHAALELYAEAFEAAGALEQLEAFAAFHGADFYGLPRNSASVTLVKEDWEVPAHYPFGEDVLVPLRAGERLGWRLASP